MRCFNCDKDIKQHEGKRKKLYCNDACRKAYKRKQKRTPLPDKPLTDKAIPDISGQVERTQATAKAEPIYPVQHHSPMMVGYVPLPKVDQ